MREKENQEKRLSLDSDIIEVKTLAQGIELLPLILPHFLLSKSFVAAPNFLLNLPPHSHSRQLFLLSKQTQSLQKFVVFFMWFLCFRGDFLRSVRTEQFRCVLLAGASVTSVDV